MNPGYLFLIKCLRNWEAVNRRQAPQPGMADMLNLHELAVSAGAI
jgi:hypothetical protein